jgi:hypothetical protein
MHFVEWRALRGRFFTPWPPAAALSAVGGIVAQPLLQGAKPRGGALLAMGHAPGPAPCFCVNGSRGRAIKNRSV